MIGAPAFADTTGPFGAAVAGANTAIKNAMSAPVPKKSADPELAFAAGPSPRCRPSRSNRWVKLRGCR